MNILAPVEGPKKIATLGPAGTFSGLAALDYLSRQNRAYEIEYFASIKSALRAIGSSCEMGVLPIENFSEGFIPLVLDHLVDTDLTIVGEILLPIRFSFVSAVQNISEVDQLFVQFVAKGQCSEFVESLKGVKVISTESNIESLDRVVDGSASDAAIVPSHSFGAQDFQFVIENVNDFKNNQTRFLVLSGKDEPQVVRGPGPFKTSVLVLDDNDHPGFLGEILTSFSKRQINLTSIISRPTRKEFGKYHFFIDFDGSIEDPPVDEALKEIGQSNTLKFLGTYQKSDLGRLAPTAK